MTHVDMRKLAPAAQEERRRQAIGLGESGLTYEAIAVQTGLSKTGVFSICQRFVAAGVAGTTSQPRGPEPGTGALLHAGQEAEVRALICRHTPDELGLPFARWSQRNPQDLRGAAVRALVEQRCGVRLAVRTMGTYLGEPTWRAGASRPRSRCGGPASSARPTCSAGWGRTTRPSWCARREKGVVFSEEAELRSWGDESGLRGDDVRGRSYAPRGRTPVVRPNQRRASVGSAKSRGDLRGISAVSNRGGLRWMVLEGPLKAPVLIRFGERLIRAVPRKVFLILDLRKSLRDFADLPAHRSRAVQAWLAERRKQIEVFYLPAYSPDLNPDEELHADLKQAVTGKLPARSRPELKRRVINHMRRLSKLPGRVRSFFHRPTVRYAA